jgi:hypothetical protein
MRNELIITIMLILSLDLAAAALVNVQGYIFYHNGSAVPAGTPVNLTQLNSGFRATTTTIGVGNYYIFFGVTVDNSGSDVIQIFSWTGVWNGTDTRTGLGVINMNITYTNIPPVWNATLPSITMDEDNLTGVPDAFNASDYCFDYDGQAITYTIGSQTNPSLVNATISGGMVSISPTARNSSGSSSVCINADDSEDVSSRCFTITVNAVPDIPSFTAAADNFTGTIISNDTTIRVTSTAFDGDGQQVRLYVCNTTGVNAGGCTDGMYCTALAASNPACSFTTEDDETTHTWHAFIFDTGGSQATTTYNDTYTTDSLRPVAGTATLHSGLSYSDSTTVVLNWSGFSDSMSGIQYYYYSTSNNEGTRSGNQVSNTTTGVSLTLPQGTSAYYVWAEDFVGHIGLAASDSIIVDTEDPVFSGWSQLPADVSDSTSGAMTATATITDTTMQGTPTFRYRFTSTAWSSWTAMTSLGANQYRLSITANWSGYTTETLYYEANATDYFNRTVTEAFQDTIQRTGLPPTFFGLINLTGQEDSNISFTLVGVDSNSEDTVNFTASCCFTIVPLTNRTALAHWTPDNDDVGVNGVLFNVTDGVFTVNSSITVTVLPVNDAPVIDDFEDLTGYLYVPFGAMFTAWDPDNENS